MYCPSYALRVFVFWPWPTSIGNDKEWFNYWYRNLMIGSSWKVGNIVEKKALKMALFWSGVVNSGAAVTIRVPTNSLRAADIATQRQTGGGQLVTLLRRLGHCGRRSRTIPSSSCLRGTVCSCVSLACTRHCC